MRSSNPRKSVKNFWTSVAVCGLTLAMTSCSSLKAGQTHTSSSITGCTKIQQIPNAQEKLTLPCLNGHSQVNIRALKGPALINVWGSWCEPCKREIPYLKQVYSQTKGKVAFIGINIEDPSTAIATKFAQYYGMLWPHLYDKQSRSRTLFGVGVPATLFINSQGRVVHLRTGPYQSTRELVSDVTNYLGVKIAKVSQ